MRARLARLAALAACVLSLQCGGGSPSGPVSPTPSDLIPPSPPVSPPPVPSTPQVFVGAGDIAMCDGNSAATARLLDGIGGTVFTTGDNAYFQGTRENFRDCYEPTWGRHKGRTRPVPGNHDYESRGAIPYFEYFGANAGPYGLGYYSFEIGAWHAVALNSNIDVSPLSEQALWLQADLAASRARCTVAYFHHPLFSAGPSGASPSMRTFWRMLYDAGVELVLNGHEHYYERLAPQDPDGRPDAARGIRQFTVGTGGAFLYDPLGRASSSEWQVKAFGVLKLTLRSDGYDWDFIPVSGQHDTGTGTCH